MWTAEEEGFVGATAYATAHKSELKNLNFVMESDEGTFTPLGLLYSGGDTGACILAEVLKYGTAYFIIHLYNMYL